MGDGIRKVVVVLRTGVGQGWGGTASKQGFIHHHKDFGF